MKRPLHIAATNGASRVVVGLAERRLLLLSFETFVAPLAADRRDLCLSQTPSSANSAPGFVSDRAVLARPAG